MIFPVKTMKKFYTFLLTACLAILGLWASTSDRLELLRADGSFVSFLTQDIDSITYEREGDGSAFTHMTIWTNNGERQQFSLAEYTTVRYVAINPSATLHHCKADSLGYRRLFTEQEVMAGVDTLNKYDYFGQSITGQYCLRGAKNGQVPQAHAYQRQYSLGPDAYAQYFVVPHKDFMYGSLTSTYNVSREFNGDPLGSYTMVKNAIVPILNHPAINSIPEIKAINLLYFSLSAQEKADLSGPFTYREDLENSEDPAEYNSVEDIYTNIVADLDSIVACLKFYEEEVAKGDEGMRPAWYKGVIDNILFAYHQTSRDLLTGVASMESYWRLANSLKLRMAMHIVKVNPDLAKKWAEEAVASDVVESADMQQGVYPMVSGFSHPLIDIVNSWGDLRMCASFESLLKSLNHPFLTYVFMPNGNEIEFPDSVMAPGTRHIGIRAGHMVPEGQTYPLNPLQAYSTINNEYFQQAPLYFVSWAEADFLRAEGAIRGWNMGGTAEEFYNRGIKNGYLGDPMMPDMDYEAALPTYMEQTEATPYVSYDPYNGGEPWKSVTTIGVKWNDGDSQETKLEKIITQKYIALFPLSTEAWAEMRRTGYPKVFPVLNTDDGDGSIEQGEMIHRIPWCPTDPIEKERINASGIPALGGPDLQATRLWWDVDAPNF